MKEEIERYWKFSNECVKCCSCEERIVMIRDTNSVIGDREEENVTGESGWQVINDFVFM